ncbi:Glu/Leu/Phe/Val dehydrogenase dimerization domain-containing protein [Actinomadura keratinilytica]|uniref:Glu/Leu/Phe/Val dehydrogenase dimerization domain-containing protein n=1 Tax=Actinomadura keratinilytica TaxID=547461 RepID=UPI003613471D
MPNVFGTPHKGAEPRHEQVVFCQDEASGLRAIIAIYSTALGPALGGTRFYPYRSEDEALADVLNLSRGMAYKNALAGLDHGGGKAVIIGDPAVDKTEALLRAYGRFVQSLNGRYYTACDVGTYSEDMDVVARESRFVTGRTTANGGAGDSSVLTAYGVFQGMRAAAETVWGSPRCAAGGWASRASAKWATGWWSTCARTAPRWWSATSARRRWNRSGRGTPRWRSSPTATP